MLIKIGKMGKNNHNCPKVCYTENDFLNGLSKEKKSEYEKYYPLLDFDIIPKKFAKLVNGIIEEKRSKTPILRYEDIAKEWNINRKTLLEIRKGKSFCQKETICGFLVWQEKLFPNKEKLLQVLSNFKKIETTLQYTQGSLITILENFDEIIDL